MRVMIVEDQALLREGLARLFGDGGHEVVGALDSAELLRQAVEDEQPDLVVLDIRMPPTFTDEGARAAREIKTQHPGIGVLVLSQHVETTHLVNLATLEGQDGHRRVLAVLAYLSRLHAQEGVSR